MFQNKSPRYEILSQDAMAVLDKGWRRIVSEMGVEFMHERALDLFRAAGQKVEGNNLQRRRVNSHCRHATQRRT